jgi:hypothetical protein
MPTDVTMPRPKVSFQDECDKSSVTAAITCVSFPTVEGAVRGRLVRGRAVLGVERVPVHGLRGRYSAI